MIHYQTKKNAKRIKANFEGEGFLVINIICLSEPMGH